ncbi:MAG TPA: GxxExxY protein [Chitinophagaceae bacterium]|jgi:GxxExxY protein|nr:GxxExxY protein [Chitinophagaceae bacterium]
MESFLFKNETYRIIGVCMEVQKTLGYGFSEVVYKDAIEVELIDANVAYAREAEFSVCYKERNLSHKFFADFYCFEKIIVEVKSCDEGITDNHIAQTLNYLRASVCEVGLIINFGKRKLEYKRLILSAA